MNIRPEFIIQRQGKSFVLFVGLLDAAHEAGLVGIETEAVTVTANIAVFKATATFKDGRSFASHGDATPENVGRAIAPHFVRMGETRAVARALRNALNIGAASLEELTGDDDEPAPRFTGQQANAEVARRQAAAREMARDDATPQHGSPAPEGNVTLAAEWATARKAQKALRDIGVTPPMLPPDDATKAELDSFAADCRGIYAKKKPQQGAVA